jgi:hypothetical protein
MSYNTQFKVKYYDIECELLNKLTNINSEKVSEEETNYSSDDVLDVCHKLYKDEFLSVFYADDFSESQFNTNIDYVQNKMMENETFKKIIEDLLELTIKQKLESISINQDNLTELIFVSLFSQQLFHMTHKCICQQIELGVIDDKLLSELRKNSIDVLKREFDI